MFAKSIIAGKKGTPQGPIREFPHDSRRGTFGKGAR
jgi:hypothetical protein